MKWKRQNPVFPVRDVAASIDWYGRVFGFEPRVVNPPGEAPVYSVLVRNSVSIHLLREDEAPHGLRSPVEAQFWLDSGGSTTSSSAGRRWAWRSLGRRKTDRGIPAAFWSPIPTATSCGSRFL